MILFSFREKVLIDSSRHKCWLSGNFASDFFLAKEEKRVKGVVYRQNKEEGNQAPGKKKEKVCHFLIILQRDFTFFSCSS